MIGPDKTPGLHACMMWMNVASELYELEAECDIGGCNADDILWHLNEALSNYDLYSKETGCGAPQENIHDVKRRRRNAARTWVKRVLRECAPDGPAALMVSRDRGPLSICAFRDGAMETTLDSIDRIVATAVGTNGVFLSTMLNELSDICGHPIRSVSVWGEK